MRCQGQVIFRESRGEVVYEKPVSKTFAKTTRKHLGLGPNRVAQIIGWFLWDDSTKNQKNVIIS